MHLQMLYKPKVVYGMCCPINSPAQQLMDLSSTLVCEISYVMIAIRVAQVSPSFRFLVVWAVVHEKKG